jgi:hypothetical protein
MSEVPLYCVFLVSEVPLYCVFLMNEVPCTGSAAGCSYWLSCYPLDIVKNRLQANTQYSI